MSPRCFTLWAFCLTAVALNAQTTATGAAASVSFASSVWCGNVTPTTASVVVRLNTSAVRVRLAVSLDAALASPIFSGAANTAATSGNTVTLSVQGLRPDTDYYYGIEVAGALRAESISRGRFHTFPLGRASFRIAFAGDSDYTVADQSAFDAVAAEHPLLFIHLGDLHYHDTNTTNADDYRANYDAVLNQPNQSALFRAVPIAYMWDDHDDCGNGSDSTSVGQATARAVYKERVPHYPIAANAGGSMAQSFTVGRVRVIMTDLRSCADPLTKADTVAKTHLGTAQKSWFKQELITARDAGFPLILWVCGNPWIGKLDRTQDIDNWTSYQTERTELANFIRDNHVSNVVLLSADMHALAYDDGTHSDYATGGGAPLVVLQSAALSQDGSIKGGPYTGGPLPGGAQYGILEVYDNGGPGVACRFLGMNAHSGLKLSYIFSSVNAASPAAQALINTSMLPSIATGGSVAAGFVISGNTPRTVLVRAVGPTLRAFGFGDALSNPVLSVFQQDGKMIANNSAWAETDDAALIMNSAFARAGAFQLTDRASNDAAVLLTLAPGNYTLQVKASDGGGGSALVEIYDVPQ